MIIIYVYIDIITKDIGASDTLALAYTSFKPGEILVYRADLTNDK